MAYRTIWWTAHVALLLVAMSLKVSAAPALRISVYAPEQMDSPARIVGLAYVGLRGQGDGFVQFLILNVSSKPVVGVEINSRAIAPLGCAVGTFDHGGFGSVHYHVNIPPSEQKLVLYDEPERGVRIGFGPSAFVGMAKHMEAAHLQVQFRIDEVDFADGSKWEVRGRFAAGPPAFDSALVTIDSEKCSDADEVAATTQALGMIESRQFTSNGEGKKPHDGGETESSDLPQVHFSCNLDDRVAVCSPSAR